mgnify:CR=1 FL=1
MSKNIQIEDYEFRINTFLFLVVIAWMVAASIGWLTNVAWSNNCNGRLSVLEKPQPEVKDKAL